MKKRKLKKKVKRNGLFIIIAIILIIISLNIKNNKIPINHTFKEDKKNTITKNTENKSINITVFGDLLFETPYYNSIENENDDSYFELIKEKFKNDDLTIGNMEVPIGNSNMKISGDGYNFCAPEWIGNTISKLGIEVLSTANNHSYDRDIEGVFSTIDYFKNNTNIKTVGTQKQEIDNILTINNTKISFLAYTLGTNITVPKENRKYINLYKDPNTKNIDKERLKKDVENAKQKSNIVITIIHWGTEFSYEPNNEQKELANYLNELGVDIIVGSHSHSIQPIELIEKENTTLVFYSLGNFTSADEDISRAGEEFDNAYQFGLIGSVNISFIDNKLTYNNIESEIIVNYYDKNMKNFKLVPLYLYDKYEKNHYRYNHGLTIDNINKTYEKVIKKDYR